MLYYIYFYLLYEFNMYKKNKEILEMNYNIIYIILRELYSFYCLIRCLFFKLVVGFLLFNEKEGDKIYNFLFRVLWILFIFILKLF